MCSETRRVVQRPHEALRLKVDISRVSLAFSKVVLIKSARRLSLVMSSFHLQTLSRTTPLLALARAGRVQAYVVSYL